MGVVCNHDYRRMLDRVNRGYKPLSQQATRSMLNVRSTTVLPKFKEHTSWSQTLRLARQAPATREALKLQLEACCGALDIGGRVDISPRRVRDIFERGRQASESALTPPVYNRLMRSFLLARANVLSMMGKIKKAETLIDRAAQLVPSADQATQKVFEIIINSR